MLASKARRLLWLARRPTLLRKLLSLGDTGYLAENGWTRSVLEKRPVDAEGRPIPWVTLPFLGFVVERLRPEFRMLEFGSGASTHYYAARVARVDSIEHDAAWHAQLASVMPGNVRVALVPLEYDGAYCRAGGTWGERYDLVMVDGRDRANCIMHVLPHLDERGCLVLDDSERPNYSQACGWLAARGFKRLDFWGMAPGLEYRKCTSIFYRTHNCLAI
jgi:hypothetical protein